MQPTAGFVHLDSLVDDIKKKEGDRVKLESQLRQQRLRAESEAADACQVKIELEAASSEMMSLQKQIGLLSRKNEDLAGENAKLMEEKCDFQRSMTNNEAKLRENEQDLKAAQQGFVEDLEKINISYSRNRAEMNTLLGRKGAGCAEIPSPEELDALKAAAAGAAEAKLRAAEVEARMHAVEAESQALKREVAESVQRQQSLRLEVVSLKEKLKSTVGGKSNGDQVNRHPRGAETANEDKQQSKRQQEMHEHISKLEHEVARLDDTCNRQQMYIDQLEEYANGVEDINAELNRQLAQGGDRAGGSGGQGGHEHDGAVDSAAPASDLPGAGAEGSQDQDHRKGLTQNVEHGNAQALPGASRGEQGRE
ncbi:unnamed protein product [Pylaiella littoralis]